MWDALTQICLTLQRQTMESEEVLLNVDGGLTACGRRPSHTRNVVKLGLKFQGISLRKQCSHARKLSTLDFMRTHKVHKYTMEMEQLKCVVWPIQTYVHVKDCEETGAQVECFLSGKHSLQVHSLWSIDYTVPDYMHLTQNSSGPPEKPYTQRASGMWGMSSIHTAHAATMNTLIAQMSGSQTHSALIALIEGLYIQQ